MQYLFEVYTEEEIETLFVLLSRLYAGIENLEKRIADGNMAENQEVICRNKKSNKEIINGIQYKKSEKGDQDR